MRYNWIKQGVHIATKLPKAKIVRFKGSDIYADFVAAYDKDNNQKLYHTYNFRRWEEVTDIRAVDRFYGMSSRVWMREGRDGEVGYMPYHISFFDKGDKMVLQFEGFVFMIA